MEFVLFSSGSALLVSSPSFFFSLPLLFVFESLLLEEKKILDKDKDNRLLLGGPRHARLHLDDSSDVGADILYI
jgi:hypothetical protein